MRNLTFILTILAFVTISCEEDTLSGITDSTSREEDNNFLESLSEEISDMAEEFECVEASEWQFTAIGTKACGGPTGFIAYSTQIDAVVFLEKVNLFTEQQDIFNKKWKVFSDCTVPPQPEGIICVDGKPEFYY
ncbi:MAG: hypothetical protein PF485_08000 [Bacteroidales bacterium]|jgi:hypothetical protein|nr:hypothetical protein [Bacteroidales bacterium]